MGYEKEDIIKQSSPREWASFLFTKNDGQAQKSIIEGRSSSFRQGGLEENNWVYKPKRVNIRKLIASIAQSEEIDSVIQRGEGGSHKKISLSGGSLTIFSLCLWIQSFLSLVEFQLFHNVASQREPGGTKERLKRSIPPITELRKHSWNSTRHAWDKEIECLLLMGKFAMLVQFFFSFSVSFSQMRTCMYVRALALPFLLSPSKLDFTVYPTSPPRRTPTQKTTLGRNGMVSISLTASFISLDRPYKSTMHP